MASFHIFSLRIREQSGYDRSDKQQELPLVLKSKRDGGGGVLR